MQVTYKQRSISKGIIEAKDKTEVVKSKKDIPYLSPGASKRNTSNQVLNKTQGTKEEHELLSDNNKTSFNNPINILTSSQSYQTNLQKYTKTQLNPNKSNILNSSLSNLNSSVSNNFNAKNLKLDSMKTQIKKNAIPGVNTNNTTINLNNLTNSNNNVSGNKLDISPLKKVEQLKSLTKKKTGIISMLTSSQNSTVIHKQTPSNPVVGSINLKNSISQNNQNLISNLHNDNMNIFQEKPLGINLSQKKLELVKSNTSIRNNTEQMLNLTQENSTENIEYYHNPKQSSVREMNPIKKHSSNIETKDNSSFNSTIKLQNNYIMNSELLQSKKKIENPEDLHVFYVQMLQSNKDLIYKFEKEE
jgi:hypothetical protein